MTGLTQGTCSPAEARGCSGAAVDPLALLPLHAPPEGTIEVVSPFNRYSATSARSRSRTSGSASRTARSPRWCSSRGSTTAQPVPARAWRSWTREPDSAGAARPAATAWRWRPRWPCGQPAELVRTVVHRHGREGRRLRLRRVELERGQTLTIGGSEYGHSESCDRAARQRVHRPRRVRGGETCTSRRSSATTRRTAMRLLPPGPPLDVVVHDGAVARSIDAPSASTAGAAPSGHGACPPSAALGHYQIDVSGRGARRRRLRPIESLRDERRPAGFCVAAFRQPDFRVETALSARSAGSGIRASRHGRCEVSLRRALGTRLGSLALSRVSVLSAPAALFASGIGGRIRVSDISSFGRCGAIRRVDCREVRDPRRRWTSEPDVANGIR